MRATRGSGKTRVQSLTFILTICLRSGQLSQDRYLPGTKNPRAHLVFGKLDTLQMAKLHFRPSWLCVIAALLCMCTAINPGGFPNGVLTAPRGWRSWNAVAEDVTQSFILRQVDALVARRHSVDGKPTSLLDLGFEKDLTYAAKAMGGESGLGVNKNYVIEQIVDSCLTTEGQCWSLTRVALLQF